MSLHFINVPKLLQDVSDALCFRSKLKMAIITVGIAIDTCKISFASIRIVLATACHTVDIIPSFSFWLSEELTLMTSLYIRVWPQATLFKSNE